MTAISVPRSLVTQQNIDAYSESGAALKELFHKQGRTFLRNLAKALDLGPGQYDLRSNKGGIAVSGEVTLHSDRLYAQLYQSAIGPTGVQLMYRSCDGRKDFCGHLNNFASMREMQDPTTQARILERMRKLMATQPA